MFATGVHPEMGKWMSAVRVLKDEDGGSESWGSVSMMSAKTQQLHKVHDIAQASMDRRRQSMPAGDDCVGCMMQDFPTDANLAILQVRCAGAALWWHACEGPPQSRVCVSATVGVQVSRPMPARACHTTGRPLAASSLGRLCGVVFRAAGYRAPPERQCCAC